MRDIRSVLPFRLHLTVLALGQGLSGSVISLLTAVSSLVGAMLAPHPGLATVPITATVIGAALMVYYVASLMQRLGLQLAFVVGSVLGLAGSLIAASGLYLGSFALFVAGAFVLGLFAAFNQYYRFAAVETAPAPAYRARAISYVVAGGVLGGFLGPFVARQSIDTVPIPFLATFLAVAGICVLTGILQLLLPGKRLVAQPEQVRLPIRSVRQILTSAGFVVATLNCAVGFGVMTLLMNATPLAMQTCGFTFAASSSVLQWHFVAMYAPSFVSGWLMERFGVKRVILVGALVNIVGIAIAVSGTSYTHFWIALVCFGIGWNFMFNGGTVQLISTYKDPEKVRVQGLNSLIVYTANAFASLFAGQILSASGWTAVNLVALPILIFTVLATVRWGNLQKFER